MGKFFGTDGIRGVANKELTPSLAFNVARASAYILEKKINKKPTVIIGKDTRISGDMIETAMISGFTSVGANVKLLGVIPTPAVAYLVRKYNADAGVVISASHNSYEFNGIKYFNSDGIKLPDEWENEIEEEIINECKMIKNEINENVGTYEYVEKAKEEYIEFAKKTANIQRKNINVALDCANGSTSAYAEKVFNDIGFDVKVINKEPNGININNNCGSTHLEGLQKFVKENNMDIGFAFDGDGDRLLAVDNNGDVINGDMIMALCSKYLKEKGELENNTLVVTVMSNIGLLNFAKDNNINVVQTKVGDKYVLQEMNKSNYSFGGEQSGHIIFREHNTTGDGIVTALQLLSLLSLSNEKISELLQIINIYPQVVINAKVTNEKKHDYIEDIEITDLIKNIENDMAGNGRVLIRPSGTEPLVRVMIEGKDIKDITEKANRIANLIEKKLNI